MAKQLKTDPIVDTQIAAYLDTESDFGFEIQVLRQLAAYRLPVHHGGTYDDPVTGVKRQFDLRAVIDKSPLHRIRMAIECKNLKQHFPLVVQCVQRRAEECYNDVIYSLPQSQRPSASSPIRVDRCTLTRSPYGRSEPVGKSCQQIGVDAKGEFVASDSEVYGKWSQAVSSAHGLFVESIEDGASSSMGRNVVILPCLLVPDGTLWAVTYDENGAPQEMPKQCERVSVYLGANLKEGGLPNYTISHLEMMTQRGLEVFVRHIAAAHLDELFFGY